MRTILDDFIEKAETLGIFTQSKKTKHLRLKCPDGNYLETLKKVVDVPFDIEANPESFSGVYNTFNVTLKNGFSFVFVPTTRTLKNPNALISDKQLTPSRLIDVSKHYTKNELYTETLNGIKTVSDPGIREFLKNLCESAISEKPVKNTNVDKTDLTRIFKDFGEILSALNSFRYGLDYIKFPENSNEKFSDFTGFKGNDKIYFSAKSESGAAASFKNIKDLVDESDNSHCNKVIKIFSDKSRILDKIITSCELIDPETPELLKHIIKNDVTVENLEIFCKEHISDLSILKEFYDRINRTYDERSLSKLNTESNIKYSGFVLSPMGYRVMDCLNSDKKYLDHLNKVLNKSEMIQVNLFFKNKLDFKYSKFKNSNFKYDYHNNALNANGNNFGFKLNFKV